MKNGSLLTIVYKFIIGLAGNFFSYHYMLGTTVCCVLSVFIYNLSQVDYRNTFKLREMYYQYTHVVENNAQHKWRAEQVTRAVHYSPPHACIGNTSQAIYKYLYYIYFIK